MRRTHVYAIAAVGSLLLAGLSLAYPSAPAYDPWAWIIWGREILHFHLVTSGGPTWKPLPVIFTTLFAPFGDAAPDLWLIVARAGGIMAVAMAALLGFRLATAASPRRPDRLTGLLAAGLAGAGLALLAGFPDSVALGESEGLIAALVLLAILRGLDGAPRQALLLGFAAALIRPEVWPLLGLYGMFTWRRDRDTHKLIVSLFALIGLLWFGPELWGSGSVTRGVAWAQHVRAGSPSLSGCPFCAEISAHAWPLLIGPFKVGIAIVAGLAVLGFSGRIRHAGAGAPALVALGLAWILEEAVLTQLGFSGSDRYLIAPAAIVIVAGAVGWARLFALAREWTATRVTPAAAPAGALCLFAAALALTIPWRGTHLARVSHTASEVRYQAGLWRDLRLAVTAAGGPRRLIDCGAIQTNPSEAPLAAWTLGVALRRTENGAGNVIIESANEQDDRVAPVPRRGGRYRVLARVQAVRILARCQSGDRVQAAGSGAHRSAPPA